RKDTLNQSQTKINPRQTKIYRRREEKDNLTGRETKNQQRAKKGVRVAKEVKQPTQKHFLAEKIKNFTSSFAQKHF
ncbi:hypothetical protein Godav_006626, partial [Gossypium davidsonii]|nr:hypothetical protein [Gossypium davidsonii]